MKWSASDPGSLDVGRSRADLLHVSFLNGAIPAPGCFSDHLRSICIGWAVSLGMPHAENVGAGLADHLTVKLNELGWLFDDWTSEEILVFGFYDADSLCYWAARGLAARMDLDRAGRSE